MDLKEKVIEGYPLLENAFTKEDILSGIEVLLSRQLTMSEITYKFEKFYIAEEKHQNFYVEKFASYLRYKKACGRERILDKIWN